MSWHLRIFLGKMKIVRSCVFLFRYLWADSNRLPERPGFPESWCNSSRFEINGMKTWCAHANNDKKPMNIYQESRPNFLICQILRMISVIDFGDCEKNPRNSGFFITCSFWWRTLYEPFMKSAGKLQCFRQDTSHRPVESWICNPKGFWGAAKYIPDAV